MPRATWRHGAARRYAEEEGVELPPGGKREDLLFEITAQRLNRRQRVLTEGTLETTKENHTFVRLSEYAYLPTPEDVFVPPSVVARYGLATGMTIKDVQHVRLPFSDMASALARGDVDAYVGAEPGPGISLANGVGKVVEYPYGTAIGSLNMVMTASANTT